MMIVIMEMMMMMVKEDENGRHREVILLHYILLSRRARNQIPESTSYFHLHFQYPHACVSCVCLPHLLTYSMWRCSIVIRWKMEDEGRCFHHLLAFSGIVPH